MSDEIELYIGTVRLRDASYLAWQVSSEIIFSPRDMHHCSPAETNPIVRRILRSYYDEEPELYRYLLSPSDVVRKRLLIHGYTRDFCVKAWENARDNRIHLLQHYAEKLPNRTIDEELFYFQNISFAKWSEQMRGEVASLGQAAHEDKSPLHSFETLLRETSDLFVQIALLLDAFPKFPVWMDCGSLYSDDADKRSPHQIAVEEEAVYAEFPSGKIIVLTEGKSDTRIITAALNALYPDFADAYQFIDFDEFRIEGGASLLARMIKTLSGARVKNRMIALFDNDAAGVEALQSLKSVRFPRNVRLMKLPDTKLASSYPTLGPAGLGRMNVNGSGASIELYLGRSSLTTSDGQMRPVRWAHWVDNVSRYQGVIQDKDAISKAFNKALDQNLGPSKLRRQFPEMDLLLRTILSAFEDFEPSMI